MRNAKIDVAVACRNLLGETPLWCGQSRRLWWIDIENPTIHAYDPGSGQHHSHPMTGRFLGSLALTRTDLLLVAIDLALHMYDPKTDGITPFVEVEQGLDNRLNDGRVDAAGRLWIGTMDNQYASPNGSLYRIDPDGAVTRMFGQVKVSNGIVFSPDNRTMYFTDTRRFRTWVFEVDPDDGSLHNRRIFADYSDSGDRPDGACIDVDGCLWTAFFSGSRLVRYAPDGRIDRTIPLPVSNPTCLCFGGKDLKTLYVTTARKFLTGEQLDAEPLAGSLLSIDGIGQGLPENRFEG